MTKIATATSAMRLMKRGVMDLDEPIAPHVPPTEHLRPASAAFTITAGHLLANGIGTFAATIGTTTRPRKGSPAISACS